MWTNRVNDARVKDTSAAKMPRGRAAQPPGGRTHRVAPAAHIWVARIPAATRRAGLKIDIILRYGSGGVREIAISRNWAASRSCPRGVRHALVRRESPQPPPIPSADPFGTRLSGTPGAV